MRGPLHGIPILIKDNIGTADRMTTTAGSLALEGSIPAADAFVAKMLREAGAVILGKTNLSEWANFRSTHSSSGWSGRGGQCRNPYALDRNPSGSSSGSGAAIAANLCAASVGTETDGSIVSPSNNCSLVGIKPTLGLVSRSGIIPIAHSQDTPGPMCRTVADAAILLTAISGTDPADPATKESTGEGRRGTSRSSWTRRGSRERASALPARSSSGRARPPTARREGDRGHEASGRGHRRSRRRRERRRLREVGARGPALRVQGGPERIPRGVCPERARGRSRT